MIPFRLSESLISGIGGGALHVRQDVAFLNRSPNLFLQASYLSLKGSL